MTQPTPKAVVRYMNDDPHTLHASDTGDLVGYDDYLALAAERDAAESLVSAQHDALVALRNERDAWEHRAEVAERENGEALAMLAFTGEPSSLWQAAAAARAKLDEAVQKARYESDVAAQAMAAKDAAERERGDADDALAACQAQAAGTIARIFEKLDALTAHMNQVHETLGGSDTVLTLEAAQHVVAKLADAERERDALQERWGTLVDDDGEPLNLGDMQEYIAVLHEAKEKLREKLADAEKDKERLDWMADDPPFDGIGNLDLYDFWHMVAHENGHEEATQEDKRAAFRLLLDTARTAATAQGE
jgi:hypothetical protein